jgi:hypothetical protein
MINLGKINKGTSGKDVILEKQKNGCIKCISHCLDSDGYTRIRYNGKQNRLFRILYEKARGKIPKGKLLRHLCNNAWCVNVEHLEIGTSKDNYEDMVKCGRSKVGKNTPKMLGMQNHESKLKESDVRAIYLSDLKNVELAKIYNVSKTNISYIKNKKQWKWFTDTLD